MANRILILDDDTEYNSLLRDVFTQADYEVESAEDAETALEMVSGHEYDLILSDHRLPRQTGLEFIKTVRRENQQIPIIMVSGYLDNDTIRDLIREGVDGLFIKPLNIFSLLKKTGEVIQMHRIRGESQASGTGSSVAGSAIESANLRSIPGHSDVGRLFAQSLDEHRNFNRNLLLIGPPGMPFGDIAGEVSRSDSEQEGLAYLKQGGITEKAIVDELEKAIDRNFSRITVVVLEADSLTVEEQIQLMNFAEGNPPFENLVVPVRLVFCLCKSVEDLYDDGDIEEDFYLFLGSNELHIPALKEMPEDIIAIAERELQGLSTDWNLDAKSKTILCRQAWNENVLELRTAVNRAASFSHPLAPQSEQFEKALTSGDTDLGEGRVDRIRNFLVREKSGYIESFRLLHTQSKEH